MVLPTPFERQLQETAQLANRDPQSAFARLDELYGKSMTEQDVHALATFSVHLGATGLGRFPETVAFQRRLLAHPALIPEGSVARSLWRGLAVTLHGAGLTAEAEAATKNGVSSPSDACRLSAMIAQTLAVRGRAKDAIVHLRQSSLLCRELDPKDEVVTQLVTVASNLQRMAEPQIRLSQELLLAAAAAIDAAASLNADWRINHRAWFQHGQAYLLAAKPTQALRCVQLMMELEDRNDAGPLERFYTASLACRAQAIRGQIKIARGALEACQDFAKRIEDPEQAKAAQSALSDTEAFVTSAQEG